MAPDEGEPTSQKCAPAGAPAAGEASTPDDTTDRCSATAMDWQRRTCASSTRDNPEKTEDSTGNLLQQLVNYLHF
jgi:hypothetical protein